MESGGTQRCCAQNLTTKSRPTFSLCCLQTRKRIIQKKKKEEMESTAGAE